MRALLFMVLVATPVLAKPFELVMPDRDARKNVRGFVGDSFLVVGGRGLGVVGTHSTLGAFSQGGGEFALDFSAITFPTPLGGLFGAEGELNLGLVRTEDYGNGVLADQRKPEDASDPAKMWLTLKLGLRYGIAPPPLVFGVNAIRLGLVAGVQLEGSGARSWTMGGAFTCGAHLVYGRPGFGLRLSWLSIPPQMGEEDSQLVRHQLGVDLGISVIWLGVRAQLDHVDTRSMMGRPATTLDSTTIGISIGYRPSFDNVRL